MLLFGEISVWQKINKLIRIILWVKFINYLPTFPTSKACEALSLLNIDNVYQYYVLLFIHSLLCGPNFKIFRNNFLPLIPNHSHKVRKLKIHFPNFRLNVCRQGMVYKCTELINVLPMKFLKPQSDQSLNVNFRQDVLNNY